MKYAKTKNLTSNVDTIKFIESKGQKLVNGFVFLTKPIFGFKKVFSNSDNWNHLSNKELEVEIRNSTYPRMSEISIANLVIPTGSLVRLPHDESGKMRANQAVCWSIKTLNNGAARRVARSQRLGTNDVHNPLYFSLEWYNKEVNKGKSLYAKTFIDSYLDQFNYFGNHFVGGAGRSLILPTNGFDTSNYECAAGIHFFIDIERAVNW